MDSSVEYYRNREADELVLAAAASSRAIQNIHRDLALRYRELIEQLEKRNPLSNQARAFDHREKYQAGSRVLEPRADFAEPDQVMPSVQSFD